MYSELDEVAESIFSVLSASTVQHLQYNRKRIHLLVLEQMPDESVGVINGVTEALTSLIIQGKAAI